MKHGILLINLGTPTAASKKAVRAYLREFLADKHVLDLPRLWRYLLLYGFILPFRTPKTTKAYQMIWRSEGSPLLLHTQELGKKLQQRLGSDFSVVVGMRYGQPSLADALMQLKTCETLQVFPLYPQYASAVTGSAIEALMKHLRTAAVYPTTSIIRDYYQQPSFIHALAISIKPYLATHDHLLLSYHGLPERQLTKLGCVPVCQTPCPTINSTNRTCYRAQCQATSHALIEKLQLPSEQWSMAFQSRLGRIPWIKPYTDMHLSHLIKQGIRRLAVACPSFATDCLETLEEIGLRAKEQWQALGGTQLTLIPCLNASDIWIDAIITLLSTTVAMERE